METIDLVATATQILELLSDQGISGKSLHAYSHTGIGCVILHFQAKGILCAAPEMLDAFLLEQREFFDQGAFSVWKWRLLRRGCELLKHCAEKGSVDLPPLSPWMPALRRPRQSIWKDTPTPEQLADLDNIYALVWRTNSAMLELGLTDATVGHYRNEGLAIILNRHYESGTDRFSGEILDQIVAEKRIQYEYGQIGRGSYQNLRKAAYWIQEMEVTKVPKKIITVIEPKRSMTVDKEKYRQKRVAAYCRVSTDSEEQLVSYANQKKVYTEMIASRKDWCFAGLFADEGKSGTRADKRPEFNKMINDCLAGKIDYIITKSVSRFARNTVDCLDYVRMLKSKGIGVYFEEQQIDTLKTDSELYLVIYAGFAQSESESISKNITWSVRKKFEEGTPVFMYKRFLGYRKGADGEPEIVPSEATIVERIFNLYLAGETVDKISKKMQAENYDIPGKTISFSKGMIMNMLSNERYCGDAILQKSVTIDCIEKKRKKNTGEAPMYYVQNNHPAIIDRVTFNKVQEELARRKTKTPGSAKSSITSTGKYSRYALTDVLICGNCGTRYRRVTWSRNGV